MIDKYEFQRQIMYFVLFCNYLFSYTLNTRSIKLSKGSILQAAVQCFKDLKKDKEKLETLEAKQKTMDSKYQKMQLRTFVRISFINNVTLLNYKSHVGDIHIMFLM